jgi:TolB-like protein/tetratricopeptide (TPR) repeat protein
MTEQHDPAPGAPVEPAAPAPAATPAATAPPVAPAPKQGIWDEIKDHKVLQWAIAYLGAALAIAQAHELVSSAFGWPRVVDRVVIVALILGLPVALTIAWYHGHRAMRRISAGELAILSVLLLVGVLFFSIALRRDDAGIAAAGTAAATAVPAVPAVAAPATNASAAVGAPLPNKIAVLPCDNQSPDPEDAYFASGLHQDIIWQLDKLRDLNAIPRVTVLRYAGSDMPIAAIAAELGARALLACTVRYAENRVRITAELVDATGLRTLWQENYEPSLSDVADVFAVQADIAMNIADACSVALTEAELELLEKPATVSTEAWVLWLRAYEEPDYDETIDLLEQAVAADAQFARAQAVLAFLWATELINTNYAAAIAPEARPEHQAKVRSYAERALALEPTVPFARSALTLTAMLNWQWSEAYERLVRARELTPNDVTQYDIFLLSYLGRYEEALGVVQRAEQLYPNEPDNAMWRGWALGFAGNYDAAVAAFAPAVVEAPGEDGRLLARDWLTRMEIARGNRAAALEQLRLSESSAGTERPALFLPMWAYAYGRLGQTEDARRIFAEIEQREAAGTRFGAGGWAMASLAIGDEDRALEWLEAAASKAEKHELDEGFFNLMALRANVTNDDALRQSRFVDVLGKIKGQ